MSLPNNEFPCTWSRNQTSTTYLRDPNTYLSIWELVKNIQIVRTIYEQARQPSSDPFPTGEQDWVTDYSAWDPSFRCYNNGGDIEASSQWPQDNDLYECWEYIFTAIGYDMGCKLCLSFPSLHRWLWQSSASVMNGSRRALCCYQWV